MQYLKKDNIILDGILICMSSIRDNAQENRSNAGYLVR